MFYIGFKYILTVVKEVILSETNLFGIYHLSVRIKNLISEYKLSKQWVLCHILICIWCTLITIAPISSHVSFFPVLLRVFLFPKINFLWSCFYFSTWKIHFFNESSLWHLITCTTIINLITDITTFKLSIAVISDAWSRMCFSYHKNSSSGRKNSF